MQHSAIDAPIHPLTSTSEPTWIVRAKRYLGLHEGTDIKPNSAVLKFFAECGYAQVTNDHTTPWCAAFMGAVMKEDGHPFSHQTLWATDWAAYGVALGKPIYGCIGVKKRGIPHPGQHASGHVCFILGETPLHYICLGGNQGDRVCIEAIPKDFFFAYRWPSGVDLPTPPYPMLATVPDLKTNESEA